MNQPAEEGSIEPILMDIKGPISTHISGDIRRIYVILKILLVNRFALQNNKLEAAARWYEMATNQANHAAAEDNLTKTKHYGKDPTSVNHIICFKATWKFKLNKQNKLAIRSPGIHQRNKAHQHINH